jgi:hypothetical protein
MRPTLHIHLLICLLSFVGLAGCGPRRVNETATTRHRPRAQATTEVAAASPEATATDAAPVTTSPAPTAARPLRLSLYLEASGSMFPYDAPGTTGQFKQTLNTLLNGFEQLQPAQSKLFVVNTDVTPLDLSQSDFIKTPNVFGLTKGKGKSVSTNFEKIFRDILQQTGPGQISVLVSDLIYSDPALAGMSQAKTLDAAQSLMTTVFNGTARSQSVLVVKLSADFRGLYYPAVGKPVKYSGLRPYYLCFIGPNEAMHQFLTDPAYATLRDFKQLPGYAEQWFVGNDVKATAPYYSALPNDPARKGRFRKAEEEVRQHTAYCHRLTDIDPDRTGKGLSIPVAADLSRQHLPESLLTDPTQYTVDGPDKFRVVSVKPYAGGGGATHKLLITSLNPTQGARTVTIRLRRTFPPGWVARTATTQDNPPDATSTFGLDRLLQGLEAAYNPAHRTDYFSLTLSLQ